MLQFLQMVGAVASVVGTVGSFMASSKAAENQQEANRQRAKASQLLQKKNNLEVRRQKMQTIRQGRIARGKAVSVAQAQTAQGSISGGVGSIQSQTLGNYTALSKMGDFTQAAVAANMQATVFGNKAVGYQNRADIFTGVSNIGGNIFSNAGEYSKFIKEF